VIRYIIHSSRMTFPEAVMRRRCMVDLL